MRFNLVPLFLAGLAAGLALVEPPRSPAQAGEPPLAADDAQPGVEVQARGAVHEAYAEPNRSQAVPGPVVSKEPPARVEEAPPEEKPEGDNVVWIPGYWSWDDEANNFVWTSGFWRAVPPGRTWVPGSWQKASAGFRWVSGYWGVAAQEETEYLPPPPDSIDAGPSTPAPAENYSYVPGVWVYQTTRYAWRPGYWLAYRPGWVWVSPCYRWTPCGYVFVSGYWDVPLLDRGLLFAPVCFTGGYWTRPGFIYRPAYCIQPDFLCGALFVRRGGFGGGYYFGDYFGSGYRSGFTAWTSFRFGGGAGIDLNFAYYKSAYRGHPGWERGLRGLYAGRYAGTIAAPPRTLVQQRTVINNITVNKTTNNVVGKNVNITNVQNSSVLAPVKKMNKVNVTAMSSLAGAKPPSAVSREVRVARLSAAQLADERKSVARFNTIAHERRATEAKLVAKAPTAATAAPIRARIELPKGTPPARVIKHVTPPPARPRSEHHADVKPPVVKPVTPPPAKKLDAAPLTKPLPPAKRVDPVPLSKPVPPAPKPVTPMPKPVAAPAPMPKVVAPPPKPVAPPPRPQAKADRPGKKDGR